MIRDKKSAASDMLPKVVCHINLLLHVSYEYIIYQSR